MSGKKTPREIWEQELADLHERAIIENRALIFSAARKKQKVSRKQLVATVVALNKLIDRVNGKAWRTTNLSRVMYVGSLLYADLSTADWHDASDDSYSRSCRHPKMSVGVHLIRKDATAEWTVTIEYGPAWASNSRRESVVVPAALFDGTVCPDDFFHGNAAVDGEFAILENRSKTRATRYRLLDGKRTGVAQLVNDPATGNARDYWEHGANDAEIDAEILHKKEVEAKRLAEVSLGERLYTRTMRRHIPVTYEMARNCGLCAAGINAWKERYGHIGKTSVPLSVVAKTAPEAAKRIVNELYSQHRKRKEERKSIAV